jgi:hypothetical protein
MSHDDYAAEPDPAAPGQLPKGENILWQGKPDWVNLAWRVYHLREVAAYFALLIVWRVFSGWWETGLISKGLIAALPLLVPCLIATMLIVGVAILSARTTQYTITSHRLVLRVGIAMPATINLPFNAVAAADLRHYGEGLVARGSGDIGVALTDTKFAYAVLWPHVRPWHLRHPQPMMRCVPHCEDVAKIVGQALSGEVVSPVAAAVRKPVAMNNPTPSPAITHGSLAIH